MSRRPGGRRQITEMELRIELIGEVGDEADSGRAMQREVPRDFRAEDGRRLRAEVQSKEAVD